VLSDIEHSWDVPGDLTANVVNVLTLIVHVRFVPSSSSFRLHFSFFYSGLSGFGLTLLFHWRGRCLRFPFPPPLLVSLVSHRDTNDVHVSSRCITPALTCIDIRSNVIGCYVGALTRFE